MDNMRASSSQLFGPDPKSCTVVEATPTMRNDRICCGTIGIRYAGYTICIAALNEILIGTFLVFVTPSYWWQNAQWLVILICRLFQLPSGVLAILGVRQNNPALIVPFILSQVSLGSYADLHTYIQLISPTTSPIRFVVVPIIAYAIILICFIYTMYIIVRAISIRDGTHLIEPPSHVEMGDDLLL